MGLKVSYKTKLTLMIPLIVCFLVFLLLFSTHHYFERYIKDSVSSQQYLTLSVVADEIDLKLKSNQQLLVSAAQRISPKIAGNPEEALRFLESKEELMTVFDNGLFLFDADGRMIAELPMGTSRTGKDFSFRDYLKITTRNLKPFISDPYVSSLSHKHPAVMFTAPVLDGANKLIAVLGGSLDLMKPNAIGRITDIRIGKTGYMFLFSKGRQVIIHPDKSRIMQHDIPPGKNLLLDRAVEGFEGTGETVNTRGVAALSSFRHLKSKNWIIGANYPIEEAYRPLYRLHRIFSFSVFPVVLLIFFIMRRFLGRLFEPLAGFVEHILTLQEKKGGERVLPGSDIEEFRVLGESFNKLMTELDRKQEEIARSEVLYRTLVEFSSDLVFWLSPERKTLIYISPNCDRITGYHDRDFYADPDLINRIIHPESAQAWSEHLKLAGSRDCMEPMELSILTKQGIRIWVNHVCRPVYSPEGVYKGIRGSLIDMTQIKMGREALAEINSRFRDFFEHSRDAILVLNGDFRIDFFNKSAMELFSCSENNMKGLRFESFLADPSVLDLVRAEISDSGSLKEQEIAVRPRNGQQLECLLTATMEAMPDGSNPKIHCILHDISERKLAEERLKGSFEYLAALNETIMGLMSRLDLNRLLEVLVTRVGKLMKTEHCYVYLKSADGSEMRMIVQTGVFNDFTNYPIKSGKGVAGRVWETGAPFCVENYSVWEGRILSPDRDVLRAMAGVPLWSRGEVTGVIGLAFVDEHSRFDAEKMERLSQFGELASIALDNARLYDELQKELVERKKAEEVFRKFSFLVEQSPVSIMITDPSGMIEYVNPRFSELTGYGFEEAVGRQSSLLKSGLMDESVYSGLWKTIKSGQAWRGEMQNRKKNGDIYWEQALIGPIRDASGMVTNFIALKEDISERKKLEDQLRHSQKMDAIGQLAGGIAHDFNNILTAIIGYASITKLKLSSDSQAYNTLDQILGTAERGASLTQGLLAFSRKQVSSPSRVDLNQIVGRIEKLLERLIGEDLVLETEPCGTPLTILADSVEIEQVLMNLATNARDALPGGGRIRIVTEKVFLDSRFILENGFGEEGEYALVTFSDNGHGMDDETVKRIFEPFFTTKEVGKGTGLGLSIVYGIIKKHNGFVTCSSIPDVETSFRIYLPIDPGPVSRSPEAEDSEYKRGNELILVAEDSVETRLLACTLLEEFGYTVIEAVDGPDAVKKFNENRGEVSLCIIDMIMPGMNGRDVYEQIVKSDPEVKVIFSSGYTQEILADKGLMGGRFMDFIVKPYMPKELLMKIREVLDRGK